MAGSTGSAQNQPLYHCACASLSVGLIAGARLLAGNGDAHARSECQWSICIADVIAKKREGVARNGEIASTGLKALRGYRASIRRLSKNR